MSVPFVVALTLLLLVLDIKRFSPVEALSPEHVAIGVAQLSYKHAADGATTQLENAQRLAQALLNATTPTDDSVLFSAPRLLVFPELSLGFPYRCDSRSDTRPFGGSVPVGLLPLSVTAEGVIPCTDSRYGPSSPLGVLSCAIRASSSPVDVVVGVVEVVECEPSASGCSSDGFLVFDTAVYFASDGSVRAKYRKHHLFTESACMDAGPMPGKEFSPIAVPVTWSPSPIGMLVCFDMEFHDVVDGLRLKGVRLLALPTSWVNVLPVSDAIGTQNAFSWFYSDLVLAAANIGYVGGSGSGIYYQGTPLVSRFNASAPLDEGVVVADVPMVALAPLTSWMDDDDPYALEFIDNGMGPSPVNPPEYASPCGPPMYSHYPTSNCSILTIHPNETFVTTIEATAGVGLTCRVTFSVSADEEAGGDPVHFAAFALAFNVSGKYMEICSFVRCESRDGDIACSRAPSGLEPTSTTGLTVSQLSMSASFTVNRGRLFPSVILSRGDLGDLDDWDISDVSTRKTACLLNSMDLDDIESVTLQAV